MALTDEKRTMTEAVVLNRCRTCATDQLVAEFHLGQLRQIATGRSGECRGCVSERHRARYRAAGGYPPPRLRAQLYVDADATCYLCGDHVRWDDYQLDHVLAIYHGGRSELYNYGVTHAWCNRAKARTEQGVRHSAKILSRGTNL